MQSYFQNRKKLHKLKILKELYIESWTLICLSIIC